MSLLSVAVHLRGRKGCQLGMERSISFGTASHVCIDLLAPCLFVLNILFAVRVHEQLFNKAEDLLPIFGIPAEFGIVVRDVLRFGARATLPPQKVRLVQEENDWDCAEEWRCDDGMVQHLCFSHSVL